MDFSLTEEQQLLKDSVDRFVRENYEFETRRKTAATSEGFTDDNWKQMAELGWLAVALPEEFGGIGGGATETMVIMEGFGRGLVLEPFLRLSCSVQISFSKRATTRKRKTSCLNSPRVI